MGTVCPCEPSKAYCTPHKSFLDKPLSLPQLNTPPPSPLYPVHVFNVLQSTCYNFPYFVLLVNILTYFSDPSGSLLSQRTFSHLIWHIWLLILTFVPCFIFQTLCPDYLTNPTFLYKYRARFPVHTTCSYLFNSNKYIISPSITSSLVHCKDFLG